MVGLYTHAGDLPGFVLFSPHRWVFAWCKFDDSYLGYLLFARKTWFEEESQNKDSTYGISVGKLHLAVFHFGYWPPLFTDRLSQPERKWHNYLICLSTHFKVKNFCFINEMQNSLLQRSHSTLPFMNISYSVSNIAIYSKEHSFQQNNPLKRIAVGNFIFECIWE